MSLALEHSTVAFDQPVCLIAEIGLNHDGQLDQALRLIDAAKKSGANVAKFQIFQTDHFIHPAAELGDLGPGSLADFFRRFELDASDWQRVRQHCRDRQIDFMASVFDLPSLELYASLDPVALKIASCEVSNPILQADARRVLAPMPWLVSSGTCTEPEIDAFMQAHAEQNIVLMECVSAYPAQPGDYQPALLVQWAAKFHCLCGLSDHTMGMGVSAHAAALGAVVIEKHFTLDRSLPGADHAISATPTDLAQLRSILDEIQASRSGPVTGRQCRPAEEGARLYGRRGLYAREDIAAGQSLTITNTVALRPARGTCHASQWPDLQRSKCNVDLRALDIIACPADQSDPDNKGDDHFS
ncbi:MAG: N-acetylneuraminate synthase family protein [Leptospiraceae bacterium]|nr:N-acetylneuraminate synthase family protein [Leptospiraceae bacterium]